LKRKKRKEKEITNKRRTVEKDGEKKISIVHFWSNPILILMTDDYIVL